MNETSLFVRDENYRGKTLRIACPTIYAGLKKIKIDPQFHLNKKYKALSFFFMLAPRRGALLSYS